MRFPLTFALLSAALMCSLDSTGHAQAPTPTQTPPASISKHSCVSCHKTIYDSLELRSVISVTALLSTSSLVSADRMVTLLSPTLTTIPTTPPLVTILSLGLSDLSN